MSSKKKPNYKLRRNIAKITLVVIVLIPVIIINRTKIFNLPIYLSNMKYTGVVNELFNAKFEKQEVNDLMEYLKKYDMINDETDDYIVNLNEKGYNKNTISYLLKNLKKAELKEFIAKKYDKDFEEYITLDLFDYSKLKRYQKYKKAHSNLDLDDVVTRIELNLDKNYYEDSVVVKNPEDITVLTNKYLQIPEDYEPKDLVNMDDEYANNTFEQNMLRKEAYEKFIEMCKASRKAGINFYAESSHRSYEYQDIIYKNYVYENGQEEADKYAARPGFSEHELGLALDLANIWTITEKGEEYAWLERHAHEYGYIIRYKKQWEDITGYSAESWHIRYVGVETATNVRKKGMSYEEYYIKYIANKKEEK